jgi:broad specificity phosphatase PhoE
LKRTIETTQYTTQTKLKAHVVQWRALQEIQVISAFFLQGSFCLFSLSQVGMCDGMTYDQIKDKYPDEFIARSTDKLNYRYPQGESYVDVIARLVFGLLALR